MDKKLKLKQILLSLFMGAIVGFINGFLGAGGGILVVPLLRIIFSLSAKEAHATAVLVVLPICLASSIVYICSGGVDVSILWPTAIGTFVGGTIGSMLLCKLKNNYIVFLFSIIMIIAGFFMIFM